MTHKPGWPGEEGEMGKEAKRGKEVGEGSKGGASEEAEAIRRSLGVIGAELRNLLDVVAPAEAQRHFRNAQLEALKGTRAMVDRRIERLSAERPGGTTIEIE